MDKTPTIKVMLQDSNQLVDVTSIDFKNRTLTWNFRGHLENTESFDDVERWEINPDPTPAPTIKPGDKVRHETFGDGRVHRLYQDEYAIAIVDFDEDGLMEVPYLDLEVVE